MEMKKLIMFVSTGPAVLVFLSCLSLFSSGCSVVMATQQPDKVDVSVLNLGRPRSEVIAELGTPVLTDKVDGKIVDTLAFVQGYHKAEKVGRAFGHGVLDLFTIGLWEIVGTPIEAIFNGTKVRVKVFYNTKYLVKKIVVYEGKSALKKVNSIIVAPMDDDKP